MKSRESFPPLRSLLAAAVFAGMALAAHAAEGAGEEGVRLGASAFGRYDLVGKSSSDRGGHDGKSVLSTGAQLSFAKQANDRVDVRAGFGFFATHSLVQPNAGYNSDVYPLVTLNPYVQEANVTYAFGSDPAEGRLSLRAGVFPYRYNAESRNLGQYLLRGPVYPGIVLSGHETTGMMPIADMSGPPTATLLGVQFHHAWGNFEGDALLSMETQYYPFYDLSPAYVATYRAHPGIRVGAGVNFYHLIPVDSKLSERKDNFIADGSDTTYIYYRGTKVMATASVDPKAFMDGHGMLGPEDLKIYAEAAVIGLEGNSAYREVYGDYLHRMPVMAGFNLPAFGFLDYLSAEVEWYGAKFNDDLSRFNKGEYSPFPVPTKDSTDAVVARNVKRDNWKWSLQGAKTLQGHIRIMAQVANDHWRPGIYRGYSDSELPLRKAILVTPRDWHSSLELSWFF
jgi:hypothetical protein